jgi:hypothetical protein
MSSAIESEWYKKKRLMVEDAFKIGKPKLENSRTEISPSDRYYVEIVPYKISDTGWDYCESVIFRKGSRDKIGTVLRNYGRMPLAWCENHLKTKDDYLLCGEDYQGVTVVNLNTGEKTSWIGEEAKVGSGFCMADALISPDHSIIAVHGCYWGGAYEIHFFDFNDPEKLPWKSIGVFEGFVPMFGSHYAIDEIIAWDDDQTLLCTTVSYHHAVNQTRIEEIDDVEEFDWLWEDPEERIAVCTTSVAISPDGKSEILEHSWSEYDSKIDG